MRAYIPFLCIFSKLRHPLGEFLLVVVEAEVVVLVVAAVVYQRPKLYLNAPVS
jgi:hypothetical protein